MITAPSVAPSVLDDSTGGLGARRPQWVWVACELGLSFKIGCGIRFWVWVYTQNIWDEVVGLGTVKGYGFGFIGFRVRVKFKIPENLWTLRSIEYQNSQKIMDRTVHAGAVFQKT